MAQTDIPADLQQDPYCRRVPGQGRDGCRTPMQWSAGIHAGFSASDSESTWLPVHPDHVVRNVETESTDPGSHLALYRRLLQLRRASPALHSGSVEVLSSDSRVIAFSRSYPGSESFVVAANLSDMPARHVADGEVAAGTDQGRAASVFDGHLSPWEAIVVRFPVSPQTTNR
jgi:alpha-glucosidase